MNTIFINNTDLLQPVWRFIEPQWTDPRAEWSFFHGVPQNWLEHIIRTPNAARYRAALQATRAAAMTQNRRPVLVSHLPAITAATNVLRRITCPEVRQIAFAFNFTDLPTRAHLRYYRRALKGISEFVVFSEMERQIYCETFGIPLDNIRMLYWAMHPPVPGPENPVTCDTPYLCAIGGEGRDYALLADVMRDLPDIKMVVVARPYSIAGIEFPDNVSVFTNLPKPQTWRLAKDSMGLVVPLKSATTACGHITIVGAQLLNIPLVVTRSTGIADYASEETAALVAPGSASDLSAAFKAIHTDQDIVQQRRQCALKQAQERNNLNNWVHYFEGLL